MKKTYRIIRKVLNYLPLSLFEKRLILKPFKEKPPYNYLVVLDSCFKSKSREVILR